MQNARIDRRSFLRTTSAAAAAGTSLPYLIPAMVLGAPGRPGANEKVNMGIIGLGGRASAVLKDSADVAQLRVVAICDCYRPYCDRFIQWMGKDRKWKSYVDFRKMIDKEKLDGVMVETTTHARAWVVIQVLQAGVDAYIEKPMCLTVAEGRTMVNAARKYRCITQIGTQQRSMPINNWASDLVKHGALGKILTVVAPNFIGPIRWTKASSEVKGPGSSYWDQWIGQAGNKDVQGPVGSWWDVWTNQAELRPYDVALHHGWPRWWDYDDGGLSFGLTGWGSHCYDQINRALGTDDTGPAEVVLEEPVAEGDSGMSRKQTVGMVLGPTGDIDTGWDHRPPALTGPRAKVSMRFAGGTELKLHLDGNRGPGLGAIFVGEKGKLEINRNKLASNPKSIVRSPDNPGPNKRADTSYHVENWLECIKSRNRCTADIEIGQRSTTLCHLVSIVRDIGRVGETLKWDPVSERFTNCDAANQLLDRPRRKGYELPAIG